eukprot:671532_1
MAEELSGNAFLTLSAIIMGIVSSIIACAWLIDPHSSWRKRMECIECILHYIMGKHRLSCAICKGSGNIAREKWTKNFQGENECEINLITCNVCSGKGKIKSITACVHCTHTPYDMLCTPEYAEIWILDMLCVIDGAFVVFGWFYYGSEWIQFVISSLSLGWFPTLLTQNAVMSKNAVKESVHCYSVYLWVSW